MLESCSGGAALPKFEATMAYATIEDIRTLHGDRFMEGITPKDVTDPVAAMQEALETASDEIDGHLSARYDLPLTGSPRVLRRPCVDIAVYVIANAHTRLTKTMEDRYEAAVELLKLIAAGKAGLGRDEPRATVEGSTTGTASGADFSAKPRRFGRGRS